MQTAFVCFNFSSLLDFETNNYLEFNKLSIDNDGTYKCIGRNAHGAEKLEYNVSILQSAKVVEAVEEQRVLRNDDSMTLTCTARGTPIPVISWILDGRILSTTARLNIDKLLTTVQDSTIYFNGHGSGISYLDPFKLKKSKEKFYSQLTKLEKNTIKLEMVFNKRDQLVAGSYQCYAFNALGRDERAVEVKINEKPHVSDKHDESSQEVEILQGLPLLLACLVEGDPQPKVDWYKNNMKLNENETIKLLNGNRFLNVIETNLWDNGNFSCVAANPEGEVSLNFHVKILAPPKFIDYSVAALSSKRYHNDKQKIVDKSKAAPENTINVMEDEDTTLECFADGSPSPAVFWIKTDVYDPNKNELLEENDNILVSFWLC